MKVLTPMKAIRAKCLDCCCGSSVEVKLCPVRKAGQALAHTAGGDGAPAAPPRGAGSE